MSILESRFVRPASVVAILACAIATGACSKKEAADTPPPPPATSTAPAPDTSAVKVADVDVGHSVGADKKITVKADAFGSKDSVFASIHTTGSGSAKIGARWTFQDGQVVDERSVTVTPSGDAYTEFHVAKPSGWPAGKYTLHVLLNDQEVTTKEFSVK